MFELTSMLDYRNILANNTRVIIDCYATWCGPCKIIAPNFVKLSNEYNNIVFVKLNVDDAPDVSNELNVKAMPTFFYFFNGKLQSNLTIQGANLKSLEKNTVTLSKM